MIICQQSAAFLSIMYVKSCGSLFFYALLLAFCVIIYLFIYYVFNNALCISGYVSRDQMIIFKLIGMHFINCSRRAIKNSCRKLCCPVKTKGSQQGVQ